MGGGRKKGQKNKYRHENLKKKNLNLGGGNQIFRRGRNLLDRDHDLRKPQMGTDTKNLGLGA